ncbi:MAG: nucleotidyltransferase family protein [Gaiellaceae bacterium]
MPAPAAVPLDAIILAGGKAERLGDAAQGLPKPLVSVAGRPLIAYQIARLREAGVRRVIVSCAAGAGPRFSESLAGCGVELIPVEEAQPLGRGGGIRNAASFRDGREAVLALNGDELLDVDLRALVSAHRGSGAAATITVFPLVSPFGIVELDGDDFVRGFTEESPRLPHWVNAGLYVLEQEALDRFPERGDHERTTFPELAREGRLCAYRHEGHWLTVNTPKQLRAAEEYLAAHPEWLA